MDIVTIADVIKTVEKISDIIIKNEVYFCELDSVAGDGDFGMSVAKGFKEIKKEWETLSTENIGAFLKDCGMIITEHCGGASGPIWGSAFRTAAKTAKGKKELNLAEVSELFQGSVDGIQKTGGAVLGDKTLLDALIPAVESLKASAANGEEISDAIKKSAKQATLGAEKTKEIVAKKGRATYVAERSIGYPDAGAMALGVIFNSCIVTSNN